MTEKREKSEADREVAQKRLISIIFYVVAAVFAAGVIGCIIAYALTRLDALFIPIALCAVGCMIAFTYARLKR